jgi:hypothetical protein
VYLVEEANVVGLGIFDRVSDRGKFYLALPESSGRGPRPYVNTLSSC